MEVHTLDLQFQAIAAYLLRDGNDCSLVETGPATCRDALLAGLQQLGVEAQQIRRVFVTHIHLDHSGDAGWWAQQGADIYVHPRGAAHLIDPSKLIDSASRVYGDQMRSLWGDILPAPAQRVLTLTDGDRIAVGDNFLQAWDTPGHARHHLAFSIGDACFTGDVAGVRLIGTEPYLSVASAPPQFELQPYLDSINRLQAQGFTKLYLTHFGLVTDVTAHWQAYALRVQTAFETVAGWLQLGWSSQQIATAYRKREESTASSSGVSPTDWQRLEIVNNLAMSVAGLELAARKVSASTRS
jgi:glyoxylase-like metal-dependent hydrolase (beta-lactamase superfamily II)